MLVVENCKVEFVCCKMLFFVYLDMFFLEYVWLKEGKNDLNRWL